MSCRLGGMKRPALAWTLTVAVGSIAAACGGGNGAPVELSDAAVDDGAPYDASANDSSGDARADGQQQEASAPPTPPTRDQVLSVKLTFQGLTVTLPSYGTIPWFEPAISSLDASSRQIVYQAKHASGDTHLALSISWAYMNDGGYSYPVPGKDLTGDLPSFRALVAEVIRNGFTPMLFLAGDGESPNGGGYNDPNGWTYGYGWLMAHLTAIVGALRGPPDLTPFCILVPGWDGVMPGWQPSELAAYLVEARSLVPDGYLGLELASGSVDWGGGPADYTSPAGQALDAVLQEFPGPPTGDAVWQVAARELGPAYVRPADQPPGDDPNPPFYLSGGTPRGPWYAIAYEYDEYRWVRGQVPPAQVSAERTYLAGIGFAHVD